MAAHTVLTVDNRPHSAKIISCHDVIKDFYPLWRNVNKVVNLD